MSERVIIICLVSLFGAFVLNGCGSTRQGQTNLVAAGNAATVQAQSDVSNVGSSVKSASPLDSLRPHHVALSVSNLDETVRWYTEKLGFRTVSRREFPPIKTRAANLELNNFQIEIFEREGSTPVREARREPFVDDLLVQGVKHVAFTVENLEATAAELKRRGVEFASEPSDVPDLKMRLCFIKDNNGYLIELGQRID